MRSICREHRVFTVARKLVPLAMQRATCILLRLLVRRGTRTSYTRLAFCSPSAPPGPSAAQSQVRYGSFVRTVNFSFPVRLRAALKFIRQHDSNQPPLLCEALPHLAYFLVPVRPHTEPRSEERAVYERDRQSDPETVETQSDWRVEREENPKGKPHDVVLLIGRKSECKAVNKGHD